MMYMLYFLLPLLFISSEASLPLGSCPAIVTVPPAPLFNRTLPTTYNNDMAYYFLVLSNLAYCYNNTGCEIKTCQYVSLPKYITLHRSIVINIGPLGLEIYHLRVVFLIDHLNKAIITAFAGTEDYAQLIHELSGGEMVDAGLPAPIFQPGIEIVSYFQDNLLTLANEFYPIYNRLIVDDYPDFRHFFTGHSLGAAFAAIMSMLSHAGNQELSGDYLMVSFGEPRVGNELFAYYADKFVPTFRVVYHKDPVTHISPFATHHGTEVWYNENCGYLTCGDSDMCQCNLCSDAQKCSSSMSPQTGKSDHSKYFEMLGRGFCGNFYEQATVKCALL